MNEGSGKRIFDLLKELNALFNKNLKQYFTQWGLTSPQILVLSLLGESKEMKISDIACSMGMADSNISGIVDRLEKTGFVERIRSTEDRRIVKVKLTDKVDEIENNLVTELENYFTQILSKFSQDELDEIIMSMEKLKGRLEE